MANSRNGFHNAQSPSEARELTLEDKVRELFIRLFSEGFLGHYASKDLPEYLRQAQRTLARAAKRRRSGIPPSAMSEEERRILAAHDAVTAVLCRFRHPLSLKA